MQRMIDLLGVKDSLFWEKLGLLAAEYKHVLLLESNNYLLKHSSFSKLLAFDALEISPTHYPECRDRIRSKPDWWLGHLSYELRMRFEDVPQNNHPFFQIPEISFFRPRLLFLQTEKGTEVHYYEEDKTFLGELLQKLETDISIDHQARGTLETQTSFEAYQDAFMKVQAHLKRGDIYEMNYCIPMLGHLEIDNSYLFFKELNQKNPTPYAAFYRSNNLNCFCTSPERYLKKLGSTLISEPIKGTAPRHADPNLDQAAKEALKHSEKERSENVMIVDLVRNDLARVCEAGSVQVEELFGLYSYPSVHQMVSTISGQLKTHLDLWDAIEASFPMGSMTGAPKISAMQVIDEVETFQRGLYSGSLGYITPEGDADFNVVIRSIVWDSHSKKAYAGIGSALTLYTTAHAEYEECLLKGQSMASSLKNKEESHV